MITLRAMQTNDWGQVSAVYADGLATGHATFEVDVPTWDHWDAAHLPVPRIVACNHDGVIGWAALSPVSSRRVYAGVAEVSVYVASSARGAGVGQRLLAALVDGAEAGGLWTLQASIFPENVASIALHLRHGFRVVGRRERIAQLHRRWRDTVILERRSTRVG